MSHIRSLINKINEYREKHRKHPIFIDNKLSPLWTDIEEPCTSEDKKGFVFFILNLYKLIYEATRIKTKRSKKEERHFYTFLLPDKFLEKGTGTREFIDIVGSLRHRYAHKPPEYKVPIKTMSYAVIPASSSLIRWEAIGPTGKASVLCRLGRAGCPAFPA